MCVLQGGLLLLAPHMHLKGAEPGVQISYAGGDGDAAIEVSSAPPAHAIEVNSAPPTHVASELYSWWGGGWET